MQSLRGLGRVLKIGALVALLLFPTMALAEDAAQSPQPVAGEQSDKKPAAPAEQAAIEQQLPPPSVTQHSTRIAGVELSYSAKAGPLALRDPERK
jgi:hypothetical protein